MKEAGADVVGKNLPNGFLAGSWSTINVDEHVAPSRLDSGSVDVSRLSPAP